MFGFFKSKEKGKSEIGTTNAPSMKDASVEYFKAAVNECNKQFGAIWVFDPEWVDLLGVAADLDKANENEESTTKIIDTAMNYFMENKTLDECAMVLKGYHMLNQRQLENIMRQSGGGKLYLPG